MCVAIGGLRKNLRRAEQVEGMRSNHYGFAILVIRDKKVVAYQRSLREEDIMKVWDEAKDDDYIVTHSRIPSAGGHNANLEDCHLWMREGCYFAHNGTMSNMIGMMENSDRRTDSQYCFEEIFLPLWKSQGRNFNALVEKTMSAVTYGNRVVIVTPDGEVHYLGKWVEDHGCKMSNTSYRVTSYSGWGGSSQSAQTWQGGKIADPRSTRTSTTTTATGGSCTSSEKAEVLPSSWVIGGQKFTDFDIEFNGDLLRAAMSDRAIGELLLTQLVNFSVEELASRETAEEAAARFGFLPNVEGEWKSATEKLTTRIGTVLSKCGPGSDTTSGDFAACGINEYLDDEIFGDSDVEGILSDFATALEYDCSPERFDTDAELENGLKNGFNKIVLETMVHSKALNVGVDWRQDKLRKAFTAWRMLTNRKGRPTVVERKIEEVIAFGREGDCAKTYLRNLQAFYDALRGKKG